ncbi:ribosome 60S biogenesis N-terminal-domain-containing protein [Terfezia claveryi]|nr:ribosome 60S biogenesis N-terminal-domain-containing protein [Terfezia claveryi]
MPMSKPTKRPSGESSGFHTAKKRKPNDGARATNTGPAQETILHARQIQALLTDLSSPQALQKGYVSFRGFLQGCVPDRAVDGGGRSEMEIVRNKAILREWVESEVKSGEKKKGKKSGRFGEEGQDEDGEVEKWKTVMDGLGFASQSGNQYLLSAFASALALLVRIMSTIAELTTPGTILCRILLSPENIRFLLRSITFHQDRVSSPFLRLLMEINKFNLGELCSTLYSSIDFSTKDLGRNLEPKKAASVGDGNKIGGKDPNRPALRTVYIRFLLSFFHFGIPSVKEGVLGQRNLITPVFKHIKHDPPQLVHDILETLRTKVVNDEDVQRGVKSQVFNEWVLGHISALYTRPEPIHEEGDQSKTVAMVAHEFLLNICTKPGVGGVCFPDNGWYAPSVSITESTTHTKSSGPRLAHSSQKVFNRTLSEFITTLKPFADTLQQDLLLAICISCPELISPYFSSTSTFSFDPKLSATWIGYSAFLTSLISLPLPKGGFGILADEHTPHPHQPPAVGVVIESILPRICTRQVLTKCLQFDNSLVRYLSTRLLVSAFTKLDKVMASMEKMANKFSSESLTARDWRVARYELGEEFSRRIPEVGVVVGVYNSSSSSLGPNSLAREVSAKLLMQYYTLLPEIALGKRFDVNLSIGQFLEGDDIGEDVPGMRLLEISHLLNIAKEVGDVKWWSKRAGAAYTSFTAVLLRFCLSGSRACGVKGVKRVLKSALGQTHIFQQETEVDPFDALLESLSSAAARATSSTSSKEEFTKILVFLDDCMLRCVRTPFKYLDEIAELVKTRPAPQSPLSPLVITLAEQIPFLLTFTSTDDITKKETILWLERFLGNLRLISENGDAIGEIMQRLERAWATLSSDPLPQSEPQTQTPRVRAIFPNSDATAADIDASMLERVLGAVAQREVDVTAFDIAVVLHALVHHTHTHLEEKLLSLLELLIVQVKSSEAEDGHEITLKVKSLVGKSLVFSERCFERRFTEILLMMFEDGYQEDLEPLVKGIEKFTDVYEGEVNRNFERLISRFVPEDRLAGMISTLANSRSPKRMVSRILTGLVKCVMEKKVTLDANTLSGLVTVATLEDTKGEADDFLNILTQYFSRTDSVALLESMVAKIMEGGATVMDKLATRKPELIGSLVGKVSAVKAWTLQYLQAKGLEVYPASVLLDVLLRILSKEEGRKCMWLDGADQEIRDGLGKVIESVKKEFTAAEVLSRNPKALSLFRRAAGLWPEMDMEGILKYILGDKSRSNIMPETVSFVSSLLMSKNGKGELTAKKAWLLMILDHLTRRFGEEEVLSVKSTSVAKAFGGLLQSNKVNLSKWVPKGSLNALLEASLEKKINVEEVIELCAIIVDKVDPSSLDLAKHLQMILGNNKNLLVFRGSGIERGHYTMAWLIHRLFFLGKGDVNANISILDGVLVLYHGTASIVDKLLLEVIVAIEGALGRSCVSRIVSWGWLGNKNDASVSWSNVLISRSTAGLGVVIDEEKIKNSIAMFLPEATNPLGGETNRVVSELGVYDELVKAENVRAGKQYDHSFLLPILGYLLAAKSKEVACSAQGMVEKGAVGYTIMGLSSLNPNIRQASILVLSALVARLEEATYRARNQVNHLLSSLLASLEDSPIAFQPLPTIDSVFVAHCVQVLTDPSHFLYEVIMEMLLRSPLLDIWDIPHLLSTPLGSKDDYYKTTIWKLMILAQGLRSEIDLGLYRKRRVFENVFSIYQSPYAGERAKEKVVELVWNLAEVKGGGLTGVTRNGVVGWVRGVIEEKGMGEGEKSIWKMVLGRLLEGGGGDTWESGRGVEWGGGWMRFTRHDFLASGKDTMLAK